MIWPFKNKINDRITKLEEQVGKPKTLGLWSWYYPCFQTTTITSRLDALTETLDEIVEYLGIERKTTPERRYYCKKKSK